MVDFIRFKIFKLNVAPTMMDRLKYVKIQKFATHFDGRINVTVILPFIIRHENVNVWMH